ncbi:hypothetical protein A2U01_0075996, partial [Trifolium medium]|nr:hypothetical protein [Trifolium medium]
MTFCFFSLLTEEKDKENENIGVLRLMWSGSVRICGHKSVRWPTPLMGSIALLALTIGHLKFLN